MLFDTHSHLHFPLFTPDLAAVVGRAKEAGVTKILVVGTDSTDSQKAVLVAQQYGLWAAVGVHPSAAEKEQDLEIIRTLCREDCVAAVGEIGFDFADHPVQTEIAVQERLFRQSLALAQEVGLPVLVHSRQAAPETVAVLKEAGGLSGVWHCFSGDESLAQAVLDLGFFISFTANITYRKNEALRRVVRFVPLNRLLLETDCPFLPPEGHRGERNEPAFLPLLAKAVAEIKAIPLERVAKKTFINGCRLFGKKGLNLDQKN